MTTHSNRNSSTPQYPEARYVGQHLVIDKTEWVPGDDPEAHEREGWRRRYPERYFRCLLCGAERLDKREFPEDCEPIGPGADD